MVAVVEERLGDSIMRDLPRDRWRKLMFKAPLIIWRMGLPYLLPPMFAVITTRGRKSSLPRSTMVEYTAADGVYYVVSGWGDRAHWVKNLLVDPALTIQPVHGDPLGGLAERVRTDDDLRRVFDTMQVSPMWESWLASLNIAPDVDDFLANKDRLYIFRITPQPELPLPPLEQDLKWATWLMMSSLLSVVVSILRGWQSRSD